MKINRKHQRAWGMEHGAWSMEQGAREGRALRNGPVSHFSEEACLQARPGAWSMEHGAWSRVKGERRKEKGERGAN